MQLEKNLGGERRSEMNTVEDRTQRLGLTAPFDSAIIFVQFLHPTLRLIRTCTPLNDFFCGFVPRSKHTPDSVCALHNKVCLITRVTACYWQLLYVTR